MSLGSQQPDEGNGQGCHPSRPSEAENSMDDLAELNENDKGRRPVRRKKPNSRYTDLMSEWETKRRRGNIARRGGSPLLKTDFQGGPGSFMEFNLAGLQFARKSVLVGAIPQKLTSRQLANAPCTTQASQSSIQKDAGSNKDSPTTIPTVQNRPQRPVAYKRVVNLPDRVYQSPSTCESKPTSAVQNSISTPTGNVQAAVSMEPLNNVGQVQEHPTQHSAEIKGNWLGMPSTNDMPQEHCYGRVPEKSIDQMTLGAKHEIEFNETRRWAQLVPEETIAVMNCDQPQTSVASALSEEAKLPYGFEYFTNSEEKQPERYEPPRLFPESSVDFPFSCNDLPEELVDKKAYNTSEKEKQ
ncbi:hypothetical protein M514_15136 [Trichuris suis]|uniref:Uncharacterized protein n=1 Tax=Trichuris suis TaxID=68888 RepID=A0A085NTD6_9BILA|nr:hypothetical protein M514_15136 [Trichuris suis]KHJ46342.1 hypothetical protein D918_03395 [Trichuris suis]